MQACRKEFWGAKHKPDFSQLILPAIFITLKIKFHSGSVCAGQQSPSREQTELVAPHDKGRSLVQLCTFTTTVTWTKLYYLFIKQSNYVVEFHWNSITDLRINYVLVSCQSSVKHRSQKEPAITHCWNTCFKRTNMFSQSLHHNVEWSIKILLTSSKKWENSHFSQFYCHQVHSVPHFLVSFLPKLLNTMFFLHWTFQTSCKPQGFYHLSLHTHLLIKTCSPSYPCRLVELITAF